MALQLSDKRQQMRYFNEYMFHGLIENLNMRRMSQRQPVITTTHARVLHQQLLDEVARLSATPQDPNVSPLVSAGYQAFSRAANTVLSPWNDGQPVFDDQNGKALWNSYVTQFGDMTGWGKGSNPSQPLLPLSPYDDAFSQRSTFLRNGSKMLYARAQDFNDVPVSEASFSEALTVCSMNEMGRLREVGPAETPDDRSGMSRLMKYMSKQDYNAVSDWMARSHADAAENRMSDAAIDRACAILDHFQTKGWAYTIERDMEAGQLKANLSGTKISVRLADKRANERFIGRVYNDGMSVYYMTNKKGPDNKTLPYQNPTTQDCLKLIDFMMGESVKRNDVNQPVGKVGTYRRNNIIYNSVYYPKNGYSAVVGPYPGGMVNGERIPPDSQSCILLHVSNERSPSTTFFKDADDANLFLSNAIDSARSNFQSAIGLETLIRDAREHTYDDYTPVFSGDSGIRAIQQSYWEVLTGKQATLLRPGYGKDDYTEADDLVLRDNMLYDGDPEDIVRQHLQDNTDYLIGHLESSEDGRRFDPVNVATYMSSAYGNYRNNDDIVAALRMVDIPAMELRGSDFYNKSVQDRLIRFNPATARPMNEHRSPFVQSMFESVKRTLQETGCTVDDKAILMDSNGIVHYRASRAMGERYKADSLRAFEGEIGQIFVPDGRGMVETQFAGTDNYLFVPGYEAHVIPQKPGEYKTMEERTRLRGYEQVMKESIQRQIRQDVMTNIGTNRMVGAPTSVNSTYRRLYDSRHPLDFIHQSQMDGMSDEWIDAIIRTEAMRVKYGNEYKDATAGAEYLAQVFDMDNDPANDNYRSVYDLVGRTNMGVIGDNSRGYFDRVYTGTAVNQGIVRFMVEGSRVTSEGEIIPSADPDARTPLARQAGEFGNYDAADRNQMTGSNLMQASSVANGVKVAQMTVGGWNFDDGYIVSKEFAETNRIRGVNDVRRSLMKGDKISDMHGNKGVISIVIDPDMDMDQAREQGIDKLVQIFRDNRGNLDVIGAPFSGVSRFNAGSGRELMQETHDLKMPDGSVHEGCIGTERIIITHLPVDEKTHIYGEDELAKGKGRKASAQLAWALTSQGCDAILDECYGSNNGAWSNAREMMITMGLDMSETGVLRTHYVPHPDEDRTVFQMPQLEYRADNRTGQQKLDIVGMKRKFSDVISRSGGFLELPFQLEYQTGDSKNWRPMDVLPPDKRSDPNVKTYAMPVLSAYLRSGQEFEDGTASVHDYTNQYLSIYESALKYRDLMTSANPDPKALSDLQDKAQRDYNKITKSLEVRKFSGKHNLFRDDLMTNRMPHSATAVWTADPRLEVDQVGVGRVMAESLGIKDNDYVMTWRDPVLRDGGVRYLRAKIDDSLTGISINPVIDKSFDGDFDGDSAGVCKLQTERAKRQAMEKLTVGANLLDYSSKNPKTGEYALYINDGLDLKSAQYGNPELKVRMDAVQTNANQIEADYKSGKATLKETMERREQNTRLLSGCIHDTFEASYGADMVSFKDMKSHMASLEHMVLDGAKGSQGKLQDYAKYMGVTYDLHEVPVPGGGTQTRIDFSTMRDHGHTLADAHDIQETQVATDIKKDIGIPGTFSQRAISVLRNICPKAALEVTYPATQSMLQIKHDPAKGRVIYAGLMGPAQDLWRGYKMEPMETPDGRKTWKKVTDEKGVPVQATKAEFKKQFLDIYTSDHGLSVKINPEYVNELADALTDPKTGRVMDIRDSARKAFAAPLDRMAYNGDFAELQTLARQGVSLCDGKWNEHFVPRTIRQNILNQEVGLETRGLTKSDTQVGKSRAVAQPNAPQAVGGAPKQSALLSFLRTEGMPDRIACQDLQAIQQGCNIIAEMVSENVSQRRELQGVIKASMAADATEEQKARAAAMKTDVRKSTSQMYRDIYRAGEEFPMLIERATRSGILSDEYQSYCDMVEKKRAEQAAQQAAESQPTEDKQAGSSRRLPNVAMAAASGKENEGLGG